MIILIGMVLGLTIFAFTFIASKRNGKFYLAPIVTFLMVVAVTAYGLFFVGGFEGMAYGILAVGILVISIIGTLLLPLFIRNKSTMKFKRSDQIGLIVLPIIFFVTIGLMYYSDKGYWIIEQGQMDSRVEGYRTSTIMEGRKEVFLQLGDDYIGKEIKVKKVSKRGPTEITLELMDDENKTKPPFIKIGLDKITEPLKVQTTDDVIFKPWTEK